MPEIGGGAAFVGIQGRIGGGEQQARRSEGILGTNCTKFGPLGSECPKCGLGYQLIMSQAPLVPGESSDKDAGSNGCEGTPSWPDSDCNSAANSHL
jgi:hypothetical protein